jgi:hypothetical protein
MRYIKDAQVHTLESIKAAYPNTSFPAVFDPTTLGYLPIEETAQPELSLGQRAVLGQPEEYEPGKWRETWTIEAAPVPEEVSALQGMLAIQAGGMVAGFNTWKATLDPVDDFAVIAFFEKAPTWRRDNPYLIQGATALGLTSEQIDGLFYLAATL